MTRIELPTDIDEIKEYLKDLHNRLGYNDTIMFLENNALYHCDRRFITLEYIYEGMIKHNEITA